jgi:chromosome segregation ATPase
MNPVHLSLNEEPLTPQKKRKGRNVWKNAFVVYGENCDEIKKQRDKVAKECADEVAHTKESALKEIAKVKAQLEKEISVHVDAIKRHERTEADLKRKYELEAAMRKKDEKQFKEVVQRKEDYNARLVLRCADDTQQLRTRLETVTAEGAQCKKQVEALQQQLAKREEQVKNTTQKLEVVDAQLLQTQKLLNTQQETEQMQQTHDMLVKYLYRWSKVLDDKVPRDKSGKIIFGNTLHNLLSEHYERLISQHVKVRAEVAKLNAQVAALNQEIAQKQAILATEQQQSSNKLTTEQLGSQLADCNSQLASAKLQLAEKAKESEQMRARMEQDQKMLGKVRDYNQLLEEYNKLETANANLQTQLKEEQQNLQNILRKRAALLHRWATALGVSSEEITSLSDQELEESSFFEILQKKYEERLLQAQLLAQNFEAHNTHYNQLVETWEAKVEELKREAEELQTTGNKDLVPRKLLEDQQAHNAELARNLQASGEELKATKTSYEEQVRRCLSDNANCSSMLRKVEEDVKKLTMEIESSNALKQKCKEEKTGLESKVLELQDQNTTLEASNASLKEKIAASQDQLRTLQRELKEKEEIIVEANKQLVLKVPVEITKQLQQQKELIETQQQEINDRKEYIRRKAQELNELQNKQAECETKLQETSKELAEVRAAKENYMKEYYEKFKEEKKKHLAALASIRANATAQLKEDVENLIVEILTGTIRISVPDSTPPDTMVDEYKMAVAAEVERVFNKHGGTVP